ncbi:MAG: hypothetical protein C0510_09650 [Erythrobacter sp.]|nr:hypothetical protein [Erythrobacter sp.]
MKFIWLRKACLFAAALLIPVSAGAQSDYWPEYNVVQSELSRMLDAMERNLIEMEAIGMNYKDLDARFASFKARSDDLNQRYDELNAYCRGTFEEPEYSRRLAYCDSMGAQLDTLKAQLEPEGAALLQIATELDRRSTARDQEWTGLEGELTNGMVSLDKVCMQMPLSEQGQYCHLPPAPGPRTLPMVQDLNEALNASLAEAQETP